MVCCRPPHMSAAHGDQARCALFILLSDLPCARGRVASLRHDVSFCESSWSRIGRPAMLPRSSLAIGYFGLLDVPAQP